MPREHSRSRILKLLDDAIRRDVHFIDQYPTTLFQCLWNAAFHHADFEPLEINRKTTVARAPDSSADDWQARLARLLQSWLEIKDRSNPGFVWLRCLTPSGTGADSITVLRGHQDAVLSVAVSPDGTRVVSVGRDGTVRVWQCETARELACLQPDATSDSEGQVQSEGRNFVKSVAFTPDGTQWISGSSFQGVVLWNPSTFEPEVRFGEFEVGRTGIQFGLENLAISPCGSRIACGINNHVQVLDVQSRAVVNCWECDGVTDLAFSPDGSRIYTSSSGHLVHGFDAKTGEALLTLSVHDDERWFGDPLAKDYWFDCICVSPDGEYLVTGSHTGILVLWDVVAQVEVEQWHGHAGRIDSVAFSPDGQSILSGSRDATVRVWKTATRSEIACFRDHGDEVWAVAYFPDGERIVSASRDRTVCIRSLSVAAEMASSAGHVQAVVGACFTPAGRHVISWSRDGTIGVWNAANGKREQSLQHADEVTDVALFRRQAQLASGTLAGTLHLWDWESGRDIRHVRNGPHAVTRVAVSPDARLVACGVKAPPGENSIVTVWSAADFTQPLWKATIAGNDVRCLSFSPDGKYLVPGSEAGQP